MDNGDPSYKNGLMTSLSRQWYPFPTSSSSSAPSVTSAYTIVTPTYPIASTGSAIFRAQMDPGFVNRHRSLMSETIQHPSISNVVVHEEQRRNDSEMIKHEHTYENGNPPFRRHTLSSGFGPSGFIAPGPVSSHPSLYNNHYRSQFSLQQPQQQPRYPPLAYNNGQSSAVMPATQAPTLHQHQHNGAYSTSGVVWENGTRTMAMAMGPTFNNNPANTVVFPWNPPPSSTLTTSSWVETPQSQSGLDARDPSSVQAPPHYISASFAPIPFIRPTHQEIDRLQSANTYNDVPGRPSMEGNSSSGVIRHQKPLIAVRNRSMSVIERPVGLDMAARGPAGIGRRATTNANGKRKPLPKIYGCETCGKMFDRPSTLRVHEAIHTGAKDHECEYCLRAFTVQSNMKRHMRVCKHKPLSPPFTLYEFICTTPSLVQYGQPHLLGPPLSSSSAAISAPLSSNRSFANPNSLPFRPQTSIYAGVAVMGVRHSSMDISRIDRTNNVPLGQPPAGSAHMIPYEYQFPAPPHHQHHHNAPPAQLKIQGYKAPMIIAAMFSVNQKVPNSLSKFTLVHLECDIPLSPVRPSAKYLDLYTTGTNAILTAVVTTNDQDRTIADAYINFNPEVNSSSVPQSSVVSSDPSTPSVVSGNPLTTKHDTEEKRRGEEVDQQRTTDVGSPATINRTLRANLKPLPNDLQEERNSYYPRTRYCYHPAEYDPIDTLPGPGFEDLAIDYEEGNI